jgi:hypothetical protein
MEGGVLMKFNEARQTIVLFISQYMYVHKVRSHNGIYNKN